MDGENGMEAAMARLVAAAGPHLAFDGWSEATLKAAAAESGLAPGLVAALVPRGPVDLAIAAHRAGDAAMVEKLAAADLAGLRFRDRIAHAVRIRIEAAGGREAVRRSAAFFALPQHAADGAALVWGTADRIWAALGDESRDINWYTKRATLTAVYSTTLLYWLGDDSADAAATWEFLDRRIADVMAFEGAKARFKASPFARVFAGPLKILERVSAPERMRDLPGHLPGKLSGR